MAFAEQGGTLIPTFNLHENRFLRPIAIAVAALGLTASVGCLPEQVDMAYQICAGQPDVKACLGGLARLHAIKTRVDTINDTWAPSDEALDRLAKCESGGNYQAVSSSGRFRGRYQFDQSTWNSNAKAAGIPEFAGIPPNQAKEDDQDAMARFLYSQRGRAPWPVCGARL